MRAVKSGLAWVNGERIMPGSGGARCCWSAVMIQDSTSFPVGSGWWAVVAMVVATAMVCAS